MKNYSSLLLTFSIAFTLHSTSAFGQLPNVYAAKDHLQCDGNPGLVSISITLGNNGDTDFLGGLLGMYLSLDTLLNPLEDSLIFSFSCPFVAAGDTANFSANVPFCEDFIFQQFPGYVFNGVPFYVFYELDYLNFTPETNESDNVGFFQPSLTMGCTTGVAETSLRKFSVYPNPGNGMFTVTFPESIANDATLILQNVITQSISSFEVSGSQHEQVFDCTFLKKGTYLLMLLSDDRYYKKMMVIE